MLQQKAVLPRPEKDEDWIDMPRTSIDVRHMHIIADTFREMKKPRFDVMKMLEVLLHIQSEVSIIILVVH